MTHQETGHAVSWWTSHLHSPVVHNTGNAEVSRRFSELAARTALPTENAIAHFTKLLTDIIDTMVTRRVNFESWGTGNTSFLNPLRLETFYGPLGELESAALDAGIDPVHLPMHTVMSIYPGSVVVQNGHGSVRHAVWHA